jgi:hypothetical protein
VIDTGRVCALCGEPPGHLYGAFFGASVGNLDLHHDWDRITVGERDNGTPIKVTCYEAYTTYRVRRSITIKLDPEDVPGVANLLRSLRDDADERDCGA